MVHRTPVLLIPTVLLLVTVGSPYVAGHCDGIEGNILVVDKCQLNETLEDHVKGLNDASDGSTAFVLVKDFRFHPEVVTIRPGGTVVFVHADIHSNQQHDPRSSGPCADGDADPVADAQSCIPTTLGTCFDVYRDTGQFQKDNGDTYPVTFRVAGPGLDHVEKSHGWWSGTDHGDALGAQPFAACPPDTHIEQEGVFVVPIHCGIHGAPRTFVTQMRGAIRILPEANA